MTNMITAVRVIFSLVAVIALILNYQSFWEDGLDAYLKTDNIVFQTLVTTEVGRQCFWQKKMAFKILDWNECLGDDSVYIEYVKLD